MQLKRQARFIRFCPPCRVLAAPGVPEARAMDGAYRAASAVPKKQPLGPQRAAFHRRAEQRLTEELLTGTAEYFPQ